MSPILGAHMSISGGVHKAPLYGATVGCEMIQLFTKNSNQWQAKPISPEEAEAFKKNMVDSQIQLAIAHDSYLINLASPDETLHTRSLNAFIEELKRAELLELKALVFHPGSHVGKGEDYALQKIAESVNLAHQQTANFKVLTCFENAAGQGSNVGYSFEHLARLIELTEDKSRIGICFDTQHAFAAGYDFRTEEGYEAVFKEFDETIGIKWIQAFHLNDSKKDLGDRVDRHEEIGKGAIGLTAFKCLMNDKRFKNTPMSLETPKGPDLKEDREGLALLRSLIE